MAEERRSAPRARISGARVTYESATGDQTEADALNLGRGGLFVRAAKPLAVGKRLALEIQVAGELVPWSALGRVVWIREEDEGERRPPGMGVKLIDVEDAVVATIERLVAERAHTEPGVDPSTQPAPVAPIVSVGPARERTILGVGSGFPAPVAPLDQSATRSRDTAQAATPAREPSVAIDLVARDFASKPPSQRGPRRSEEARHAISRDATPSSRRPPAIKPGGRGRWLVVLLLLAVAAAAAYLLLDGDLDRIVRPSEPAAAPPTPPVPPAGPQATVTAKASGAAPAPTAIVLPPATATSTSAALSARVPSSSSSAARPPPAAAPLPPPSHTPTGRKPVEESNPY